MRDRAFLSKSNPPKRGVVLQCVLATASLAMLAGCANSGSGDMGTSLGGGSDSQSKPAIAASTSPTWSNGNSSNATGSTGSTGSTPIATLTGPVEQVTTTTITAIVPLTSTLTSTTNAGCGHRPWCAGEQRVVDVGQCARQRGQHDQDGRQGRCAPVSTLGNTVSALGSLTSGLSTMVAPAAPSASGRCIGRCVGWCVARCARWCAGARYDGSRFADSGVARHQCAWSGWHSRRWRHGRDGSAGRIGQRRHNGGRIGWRCAVGCDIRRASLITAL